MTPDRKNSHAQVFDALLDRLPHGSSSHITPGTAIDPRGLRGVLRCHAGRWIGDVIWISDWPGFGKKGDKVTGYVEMRRTEDGNGLLGRFYGGNGSGTWLTVHDASAKEIRETNVSSGGTVWTHVYSRIDGGWKCVTRGSNPDGRKIVGTYSVKITDGGNTHTWSGETTIDGEKQDPVQDVWQRVSSK